MENKNAAPDFKKGNGLLPTIAQDDKTGQVLMLAYMNQESWDATLRTGKVHYYSRSRQELWLKGGTSGHYQVVKELRLDCDDDTILVRVEQIGGAACHTGYDSCFYKLVTKDQKIIEDGVKVFDPEEVYKK